MVRTRIAGLLLIALFALTGCAVRQPDLQTTSAPKSNGVLVSGRYSTQQGTMRYQREFLIHPDGKITETQTVEGTHRFAEYWRTRYSRLVEAGVSEYRLTKEEPRENTFVIKAKKIFSSLDQLNESGVAELQLVNGPLFRALAFKSHTGPYDAESMIETYEGPAEATAEDWVQFLEGAISVGYVIRDEVTGRTYTWDRTAGEIGGGVEVLIQGKKWYSTAYVGAAAVGVFLLFVLYMGIWGRKHWEKAEAE